MGLLLKEVFYRGISDMGGAVNPILDLSGRKALIPALSKLVFCLPSTLDHRGNGKED